jgi:hypothetical protein
LKAAVERRELKGSMRPLMGNVVGIAERNAGVPLKEVGIPVTVVGTPLMVVGIDVMRGTPGMPGILGSGIETMGIDITSVEVSRAGSVAYDCEVGLLDDNVNAVGNVNPVGMERVGKENPEGNANPVV